MNDKLVRLSDVTAAMNSEGYTKNMRVHKKVLSIPAVDAVEAVNGEWIWDGYVYDAPWQCSECRKLNDIASNYCPHCGARMDGRREEGRNATD